MIILSSFSLLVWFVIILEVLFFSYSESKDWKHVIYTITFCSAVSLFSLLGFVSSIYFIFQLLN